MVFLACLTVCRMAQAKMKQRAPSDTAGSYCAAVLLGTVVEFADKVTHPLFVPFLSFSTEIFFLLVIVFYPVTSWVLLFF